MKELMYNLNVEKISKLWDRLDTEERPYAVATEALRLAEKINEHFEAASRELLKYITPTPEEFDAFFSEISKDNSKE